MIKRLSTEESGVVMGLVVIMIVLIGVMGAGLLTFVSSDVTSMGQTNRGEQALQVADAGVQAAQQQLITDNNARNNYDGGTDDLSWSYCYNISGCTVFTPSASGSAGMTMNMDSGTAQVTILMTRFAPAAFKVISEGRSGDAKRRIEAMFRANHDVGFPRTYMSRTDLMLAGSINPSAISFFALENATIGNNVDLGPQDDSYYGRWAAWGSSPGPFPNSVGSFPNDFNLTVRSTNLSGVAARGTVCSGSHSTHTRGARVFSGAAVGGTSSCAGVGSLTSPRVVPTYGSSTPDTTKIAFPFEVATDQQDRDQIDFLRQAALSQETSSNPLYIDSIPGNKVNDAGMVNRITSTPLDITTWPSPSSYDTVRFYEFQSYHTNNVMRYNNGAAEANCSSTNYPKGVIVVENGDFIYDGNRAFNGGIIVRAYDPEGKSVSGQGKFTASGNPCLKGYANSGGLMNISGNISLGSVPELGSLRAFRGEMELVSWRELY